jgi:antitoxin ParD1/3/4
VDERVGSGRSSGVSEYVGDLIRDDERRKVQEKLEALLLEGLAGGEATEMTRQDWSEIRAEGLKEFGARKARNQRKKTMPAARAKGADSPSLSGTG